MDTWHDVSHVFKRTKIVKNQGGRNYLTFSTGSTVGEKEGEKGRVQDFFRRSSEFRRSEFVRPRTKFIASTRAMRVYKKKKKEGFHRRSKG